MHIILASQSPRRKEILGYFDLSFSVHSSDFDESLVPFKGSAEKFVMTLAQEKAFALKKKFPDDLIISADTTVYFEGKIYEKPLSIEQAFLFIRQLQGKTHQVFTGVCVTKGDKTQTAFCKTDVLLHAANDHQIKNYINAISPLDKAGGYAIQGPGSILVSKIDGCFYNVMGLPITLLNQLLNHFAIDLWNFGKP
jgi:septum formation protein